MEKPKRKANKIKLAPEDFSAAPKPPRDEIWVSTRIPKAAFDPLRHFSVLSYNVLAQAYTKKDFFPWVEHLYLTAKYRHTSILVELKTIAADICCFQEMDGFEEYWRKDLRSLGYDAHFVKRSGRKKDGCCICWNERFKLIRSHQIELNSLGTKYSWTVERDNVAAFVCLEAVTGERFCVGNVHLHWDPALEWVKVAQARHYIAQLHQFAEGLPIIATGDFNSKPNSAVLAEITGVKCSYTVKMPVPRPDERPPWERKKKEEKSTEEEEDGKYLSMSDEEDEAKQEMIAMQREALPIVLASAYARYSPTGHPPFTNFKPDFQGTLDYIFYDSTRIEALSCLSMPTREEIKKETALPSSIYPSDHLSVVAKFAFLPKP